MEIPFVILGASTGIGAALCKDLLASGESVIALSRSKNDLLHPNLRTIQLDVLTDDFSSIEWPEAIKGLAYMPGNIRLKPFHRIKEEEFKEDFELNVLGAVKALQFFMPALKAVQQSSVVLFSTVAASKGMSFHASTASSKAALEGLALSLAAEWAPAVRVNVIAPSLTDTPLATNLLSTDEKRQASAARHALKRVGTAEDIAAMARFLLMKDSSWMTGQVLHVDGGLSVI